MIPATQGHMYYTSYQHQNSINFCFLCGFPKQPVAYLTYRGIKKSAFYKRFSLPAKSRTLYTGDSMAAAFFEI